ncbi:MAG: glycerophosphodiester phosphodiesterase family protein [Hyphomicrobiales bacterium]
MRRNVIKVKHYVALSIIGAAMAFGVAGCKKDTPDLTDEQLANKVEVKELTPAMKRVRDLVPKNIVIAHRGSTFWTPEETEAAFRWARNIGADYLEIDLQRTKEVKDENGNVIEPSVLLALHDNNLKRTSDVEVKFPGREEDPVSSFTWSELSTLDAGSWFNIDVPENARESFKGESISTLEDVIMIAKGYKLKRYDADAPDGSHRRGDRVFSIVEENGKKRYKFEYVRDDADNGNRPGVYIETKEPYFFPGIEADLAAELKRLGWYGNSLDNLEPIQVTPGKVGIANTKARIILQTFSKASLASLQEEFKPAIPTCLLLWKGPSDMSNDDPKTYSEWVNYGIQYGATIIGPSIGGAPNNYHDLLKPWQADLVHKTGMIIHAYSFDTRQQMEKYSGQYYLRDQFLTDGMFTNKSDATLDFYKGLNLRDNGAAASAQVVLNGLGY